MEYVFGHMSPDSDSYCSAVVYANYLKATPIVLGEPNTETQFIFTSAGISFPEVMHQLPQGTRVHLVDHNEAGQSIADRDQYEIVSVVDHHKIADFSTSGPLMMRVEPVGCTCTILYEMFMQAGYEIPQADARLMISAIMSDTLHFRSPTTTDRDRDAVEALLPISGIDNLDAYVSQMFDAKSDLSGYSALEIVQMDAKQFDFSGTSVGIGVMETTNPSSALNMKDALLDAIAQTKKDRGVDAMLFCIIDILNETNTTLVIGTDEENLIQNVFAISTHDGVADLGSRISRKKQLAAPLAEYFG